MYFKLPLNSGTYFKEILVGYSFKTGYLKKSLNDLTYFQ